MVKIEQTYDIDMPKSCADCDRWYIGVATLDFRCCFTKQDVSFEVREGKKPNWCPLKEVEIKAGD